MNPNRTCRMCDGLGNSQPDTRSYVDSLPKDLWHGRGDKEAEYFEAGPSIERMKTELKKLRDLTGDCPACILAALRQAGIPPFLVPDFDFKKESQETLAEINSHRWEGVARGGI